MPPTMAAIQRSVRRFGWVWVALTSPAVMMVLMVIAPFHMSLVACRSARWRSVERECTGCSGEPPSPVKGDPRG